MAVKKTMQEIASENNIDISEENARRIADAYIQPKLTELAQAEQQAVVNTQTARKSLESDYFDQYRKTMYNTQSRGLTGGLANLDQTRLRMQMGEANTGITNALIQTQADLSRDRGTALANAEAYKTNYLNDLLAKVSQLREADYAQRVAEEQFAQEMALRQAQLAQASASDAYNRTLAERSANLTEAQNMLPGMAQVYARYIENGQITEAQDYLNAQIKKLQSLGYDTSNIASDFSAIGNYATANNYFNNVYDEDYVNQLSSGVNRAKASRTLASIGTALGLAASPFTMGITAIPATVGAGTAFRANELYTNLKSQYDDYMSNYEKYKKISENKNTLPAYYLNSLYSIE